MKVEPLISVSHEFHTALFEGLSLLIITNDIVGGISATHTHPVFSVHFIDYSPILVYYIFKVGVVKLSTRVNNSHSHLFVRYSLDKFPRIRSFYCVEVVEVVCIINDIWYWI